MSRNLFPVMRRFDVVTLGSGIATVTAGLSTLLDWLRHNTPSVSQLPGGVMMKPNTAICFILAGVALLLLRKEGLPKGSGYPKLLGKILAGVVILIVALTLSEYLFGWDLRIDQLVVPDLRGPTGGLPGRMAPITLLAFLFLGLSLLTLDVDIGKVGRRPAQGLALVSLLIGLLGVVGYIYGTPALYQLVSRTSVSVYAALLFVILSLGALFAQPHCGLLGVITSEHGGGLMARRVLPVAGTLPLLLGWLCMESLHARLFSTEIAFALLATMSMATFATLLWFSARILNAFDRKRQGAEESLRQAHNELEERVAERTGELQRIAGIVASSHDAILSKTLGGTILSWNPGAQALYGYTAEEAIGKSVMMLLPPDRASEEADIISRVKAHEFIDQYESVRMRKDGSLVEVSLTISAVKNAEGEIIGASKIARDITERRRADRALRAATIAAEEASRAKGEFLANMSHEIRTPMNGVIGMTNLLLDSALSDEQRHYAEAISKSGELLLSVIDDILDFSKIEAGKLSFEVLDFDLHEAVDGCLELFAQRAQVKGLELACFLEADVPARLRGDPGRLRQILNNLVGNAIKFTDHGEVVVKVSLAGETEEDATLRLEVRDTGIGIAPDAQARLFQPFSQADGSTTRRYGGTGLGLAISKQLIEHMQGKFGLESAPGQGSTFWFTARLQKQKASEETSSGLDDELSNLRLLIVDDNETNRRILQHQTRALKIHSGVAVDGQSALAELRRAAAAGQPYQVALLDMQMPGIDGVTLAREIKADSSLAETRLILLSSFGRRIDPAQLEEAGIEDCLVKPVKQSLLFDSLAMVTGKVRTVAEKKKPGMTAQSASPETPKLRLLLAEDNTVNQQVALGLLQKLGYRADAVGDGTEVLAALQRMHYDVVLMDCQMPELDGYETTRRIRDLEEHRTAPFDWKTPLHIIAMTANAMAGDREKCLAAGMNDYLSKPVRRNDLKAALEVYEESQPVVGEREEVTPEAIFSTISSSEEQLVDIERLRDVTDDDPEGIEQLVDLYLTQTGPMLDQLAGAITTNSCAEVASLAHKILGSSVSCGVNAFTLPLRELEQRGHSGDLTGAEAFLEDVSGKFPRLQGVFSELLQTLQPILSQP